MKDINNYIKNDSPIADQLPADDSCCGCAACRNICPVKSISIKISEEGFYRPVVDEASCIRCGRCLSVCPIGNEKKNREEPLAAYAAFHKTAGDRAAGSSGGLFSAFAASILRSGGVVYGARMDDVFSVCHDRAETESDLKALCQSKYLPSDVGLAYQTVLNDLTDGKEVLFAGTPCQIAAMRLFLPKQYDKLFLLEFVCHGVPSLKVYEKYILSLQNRHRDTITSVSFHSKKFGWRQNCMDIEYVGGRREYPYSMNSPFLYGFFNRLITQPVCMNCPFQTMPRSGDLLIGDFWEINQFAPGLDSPKGISMLITENRQGDDLLCRVRDSLELNSVPLDEVINKKKHVRGSLTSTSVMSLRQQCMTSFIHDGYDSTVSRYLKPARWKRMASRVSRAIKIYKGNVRK